MPAYFGVWRIIADQPVPPILVAQARKLVGSMFETGGIVSRTMQNPDGSTISALITNGIPKVTITQPKAQVTQEPTLATEWVPRGFIVYPAWQGNTFGVGLPIVQQGDDPYSAANVAPGLDTTRWTPGGACGEVLVSADLTAGYPPAQAVPAPMLADATRGPQFVGDQTKYDSRALNASWQSYRLELAPFVAHYSDENVTVSRALFEAVNGARTGAGQAAATLRFRGFARPAEIAASIFVTAGTAAPTSTAYPLAYQTAPDRLTKEGYVCDWSDASLSSFTRSDLFAAQEFTASGVAPDDAVAAWQSQPGGILTANLGPCAWADVGYRGGFSVLALAARDRWIEAGNVSWQSSDVQLPPISWHGFASVNLAWETYPARYNQGSATAPLVPLFNFTNTNGDCWLVYPRSKTYSPCYYDGAMGRHIYSRGRSIALAPSGGLVWGACVAPNGASDRLIALIHHPSDQPGDVQAEGFTRYLRVWWVDIPRRANGQRLAPQLTICGTDATDPLAWRGGTLIDLGSMPAPPAGFVASSATKNSLKYASCWRFSPDGLHAVCLRDYAALADYSGGMSGSDWSTGLVTARAVELTFSISGADVIASTTFHDYTAGLNTSARELGTALVPDCSDSVSAGNSLLEWGALPLAVDYDSNGQLVYAYQASIGPDVAPVYAKNAFRGYSLDYVYTGTGDASVKYATDLDQRVLVGATMATPSLQQAPGVLIVLDVNSATFANPVGIPAYSVDPSTWPSPSTGEATFTDYTGYTSPTFTASAVAGVQLSHGGTVTSTNWYGNPDGALNTPFFPCMKPTAPVGAVGYLPLAATQNVQGYFASRFGETVYGYQKAPMPQAALMMNAPPSGVGPCGFQYALTEFSNSELATMAQQAPRGGKAVGSVSLPANDWLIFAKVV